LAVGAEGVRFDHVHPGFQEGTVHVFNRLRVGERQVIVAAGIAFAAEMPVSEILGSQVGAHGAVKDHGALAQRFQVSGMGVACFAQYSSSLHTKKPLRNERFCERLSHLPES